MKEFIEKWEKIFKDNKYEMVSAFILYHMSCHSKYEELTTDEKVKLLGFAYRFYMNDITCTDLEKIIFTIMENYKGILEGKIDGTNLYILMEV